MTFIGSVAHAHARPQVVTRIFRALAEATAPAVAVASKFRNAVCGARQPNHRRKTDPGAGQLRPKLRSRAASTACVRLWTLSLRKIAVMCALTVDSLMPSS